MYIEEAYGFHGQSFNFSTQEKFNVRMNDEKELVLNTEVHTNKLPKDFWGKNISEISLFVGENGAGKTTVMRLICQWICHLSQKEFPWEKGILVFREDEQLKYVAFAEGEELSISAGIPQIEIYELTDFFKDIQLVYYSNTMTELKIDGYDILQDYSMPSKMRKANVHGHAMGDDIISNYKCYEFQQQIKVALEDEEFPIKYIMLEIQEYSDDDINSLLLKHENDIGEELRELLKRDWNNAGEKLKLESQFFKEKLLQAIFYGIIFGLLKWGKRYEYKGKNGVKKALNRISFSNIQNSGITLHNINGLKDSFKEIFYCCEAVYNASIFKEDYNRYWGSVEDCVINMLNFILKEDNDKYFSFWVEESVLIKSRRKTYIWKVNLKGNRKVLSSFWENYTLIDSYLENVHISWDASSGEKNWAGLFSDLKNHEQCECSNNIWYLLDEPDNTFHPRWERKIVNRLIKQLKKCYGKKQVWISTHSPIMLSDMPGQATIYLKKRLNGEKEVDKKERYTFGQNIYVLFDDAFFLNKGVIGKFASKEILKTLKGLEKIQKVLINNKFQRLSVEELEKISGKIDKYEERVRLVAEPAFSTQMKHYIEMCRKLLNQERNCD